MESVSWVQYTPAISGSFAQFSLLGDDFLKYFLSRITIAKETTLLKSKNCADAKSTRQGQNKFPLTPILLNCRASPQRRQYPVDVTPILDQLNDAQREAVTAPAEPTLVIAGAGSGKTRVLVHRAAWLIDVEGISPQSLLAVTFTNKAAAEMRGRIESLLNLPVQHLWIGTFHGLAHRMLRRHWREANLPQTFQIIDSDDQLRLLKRLLKNLEIDDSRYPPKELQWFINGQKDEGLRPEHLDDGGDPIVRQKISLYASYEEICQRGGLVDFAELLLRAPELLRDNQELLEHYRRRFRHLLVDEFQDTNAIQYAWLRLLAGKDGVPFVVGDDDQSIYRWRGARVEHIHRFQKDFPGTRVVKARTKLSFYRDHPECRQCRDRKQR